MIKVKHIEAAREARLWIAQIILPATAAVLVANPKAREKAGETINRFTNSSFLEQFRNK